MRRAIVTAAVLAFSLTALAGSPTLAAVPCKDAKGRFIKCPPLAPVRIVRCKDPSGKFARCGTPGARPI
jgi:hypothetical protein